MDKEQTFLQMEICTLGNIKRASLKAKASIRGRMVHSILENSKTDLNMARGNGNQAKDLK